MLPGVRLPYSAIVHRPRLELPDGGRIIVWPVVNLEEWEITRPMARSYSPPPMGKPQVPDFPNWAWHEYGMRVGFWRLKEAFDKRGIQPTLSINAMVCQSTPDVPKAALEAGWEFMAHCVVQMPMQMVEDEPAMIRESMAMIEDFTKARPRGWLGPGRTQTWDTLDHVREAGFEYFGDWVLDDQPCWVRTTHGPLVSIPYSVELNDITVHLSQQLSSDALMRRAVDAFDQLYAESEKSVRVCAIGVHPYVTGAAHRIRYFEELLDHISRHDGVVWKTGDQILDWFAGQVPAPQD